MSDDNATKVALSSNAPLFFTGICVALLAGMGLIVMIQGFIQVKETLDLVAKALGV